MSQKFVVVNPVIVSGHGEAPHYRYVLWKPRITQVNPHPNEECMLIYEKMTPREVLSAMTLKWTAEGSPLGLLREDGSDGLIIRNRVKVELRSTIHLQPLGSHNDLPCYAVLEDRPTHDDQLNAVSESRIHVTGMPIYGRSTVVYAPDTVRRCLKERDIMGTKLGDDKDRTLDLFNFIDFRVGSIMNERIAKGEQ